MRNTAKIIEDIKASVFSGIEASHPGDTYFFLMQSFPIGKITNKDKNEQALAVMERLIIYLNSHEKELDGEARSGITSYMTLLADQIAEFESKRYPNIGKTVSDTEMLEYFMELHSLTQRDLSREVGGQSVVCEILKGKRKLNVKQIEALSKRFEVSPVVFFPSTQKKRK